MALYGVNFFPNEMDVTSKPYAPLLVKPTYIEMWAWFHRSVFDGHAPRLSQALEPTRVRYFDL